MLGNLSHRRLFLATSLAALTLAMACGPDDSPLDLWAEIGSRGDPITHGTPYSGHPSVGFMLIPKGSGTALCTATLVGKRTVLTAAHCLPAGQKPAFVLNGYQHYQSTKAIPHPSWNSQTLDNDIGLLILQKAPTNVTPTVISQTAPHTGLKIMLIGYGITASKGTDSGVKRMAYNYVQKVYATRFSYSGSGGGLGNTCEGDSGGPALSMVGGKEVQVGITSAGTEPCGSVSFDTRVDAYYSWLQTNSAGDLYTGITDSENPKIKITSPAVGTKLIGAFSLKATASDDVGVVSVEVQVDGKVKATRTSAPWEFSLNLPAGKHALKAVARDKKNKTGQDQISVEVLPPLGFGRECGSNKHCQSGMCARDSKTGKKFCTAKCVLGGDPCGYGAQCLPAGTNLYVCGPPTTFPDEEESIEGTCSVGTAGAIPPAGVLLLLLILVATRSRTQ